MREEYQRGREKNKYKIGEFGLAINSVSTIIYICNFLGQNFDADSLQRAKMSLFFSSNTAKEIQDKIKQRFGA